MAIPKTRAELLEAIETTYGKLAEDLERVDARTSKEVCVDDWTIVDLLVVRTRWAEMVVEWIEAGKRGEVPPIPAKGYTWKETPRLNRDIIAGAPKRRSWKATKEAFAASHDAVLEAIDGLSKRELERVGEFPWADKWPVLRWVSISTSTGYASARKYIRKVLREQG